MSTRTQNWRRSWSHAPEWEELSLNHLEGRTAGFFCYGDGGDDELDEQGRPRILLHKSYFDPEKELFEDEKLPSTPTHRGVKPVTAKRVKGKR